MKDILLIIGAIVLCILAIFITPAFYFGIGWLSGLVAKITVGKFIIAGLNLLFNTTYFTVDMLPKICGALGFFGSFFGKASINPNLASRRGE